MGIRHHAARELHSALRWALGTLSTLRTARAGSSGRCRRNRPTIGVYLVGCAGTTTAFRTKMFVNDYYKPLPQ